MSYYRMTPLLRRWLAAILALYIGLGPLGTPAFSALTPLGDQPLNIQNSAQPNIVLTIDDSTSMLDDFLPDYVVNAYCRDGVGAMNARCGSGGATNDFTAIGGGKYYSPGWTSQQYAFPYTTFGTGGGAYTVSGPGAGCFGGSPPTCSGGINPGGQPGISVYPAGPVGWPNAGLPYEYWLLWPAPPHSNGLNALAYDPTITYLPPVDSTGASLPQMDAAGTTNWTIVPADRWASPVTNVDLTQSVNVGQWCNTDWSIGLDTNPQVCRINGSNAAAFGTVTAPQGADYTYPWAPPNFTVSTSSGATRPARRGLKGRPWARPARHRSPKPALRPHRRAPRLRAPATVTSPVNATDSSPARATASRRRPVPGPPRSATTRRVASSRVAATAGPRPASAQCRPVPPVLRPAADLSDRCATCPARRPASRRCARSPTTRRAAICFRPIPRIHAPR